MDGVMIIGRNAKMHCLSLIEIILQSARLQRPNQLPLNRFLQATPSVKQLNLWQVWLRKEPSCTHVGLPSGLASPKKEPPRSAKRQRLAPSLAADAKACKVAVARYQRVPEQDGPKLRHLEDISMFPGWLPMSLVARLNTTTELHLYTCMYTMPNMESKTGRVVDVQH